MATLWKVLTRKKIIDASSVNHSELNRVLTWFDLTTLGIGSTLGVGAYVLVGHVAKDIAGPAVILSFLIAAVASVFAGLCYAEFGARAPRAGSAYIYSYICVGEFVAFVIGWNLILEYIIGSASVARGFSEYLDPLLNNTLSETFQKIAPIDVKFMSSYFDFLSFGIAFLLSVALAFGMKESAIVNNIFTTLNVGVVLFIIIAGSLKADTKNWDITPSSNSTIPMGKGGFFPFGLEGVIRGAAKCFYGFVGFDCIATTAEEVKNPQKSIPTAIVLSLFIVFLAYFGTSTVITLMVPYYLQDVDAPIPHAFEVVGWEVAKWIVAIGAMFGLFASLFGAMFPLPRIIYAMASDGLVFRILGKVSRRFKTPVIGTILAGILTGLMGALFELKHLVDMMSIGTLMAYTIVAASVLLLRYEQDKQLLRSVQNNSDSEDSSEYTDNTPLDDQQPMIGNVPIEEPITTTKVFKQLFNCTDRQEPNAISEKVVTVEIGIYCILCILIGLIARFLSDPISKFELWSIILLAVVLSLTLIVIMSIASQPKSRKILAFKVPLVPLIPALSILVNIYLMIMLDNQTWIRFAVWMAIGLPIYYISIQRYHKTSYKKRNINGFINKTFEKDDEIVVNNKIEQQLSQDNIQSTIAVLDEIIDNEAFKLDRNHSFDASSTCTNNALIIEENVVAFVHVNSNNNNAFNSLNNLTNNSSNKIIFNDEPIEKEKVNLPLNDIVQCEATNNFNKGDFSMEHKTASDGEALINITINKTDEEKLNDLQKDLVNVDDIEIKIKPENERKEEEKTLKKTDGDVNNERKKGENEQQVDITDTKGSGDLKLNNLLPEKKENPKNKDQALELRESNKEDTKERKMSQNLDDEQEEINAIEIIDKVLESVWNDIKINDQINDDINVLNTPTPPPLPEALYLMTPPPSPNTPDSDDDSNVVKQFPILDRNTLSKIKLKHVVIQSDQLPSKPPDSDITDSNDNLKFGSPEYKAFKDKLNRNLLKQTLVPIGIVPSIVLPKSDKKIENRKNENVIEEKIDRKTAKDVVKQFLKTAPKGFTRENSLELSSPSINETPCDEDDVPKEPDINSEDNKKSNEEEFKSTHRQHMNDIFKTIRLRKVDSFKSGKEEDS